MTARGRGRHGWPQLTSGDVVMDGRVALFRNPYGEKFGETDAKCFSAKWSDPGGISKALSEASAMEAEAAKSTPFAWDPMFGYLSPDPYHMGCGLEIGAVLHLEGLNLLGELESALNALPAVRMAVLSDNEDGLRDVAHMFRIRTDSSLGIAEGELAARAKRLFARLIEAELNCRRRLVLEDPRILDDSITRALAILKSARLLTKWELADLLSPVRLASGMGFIDGISIEEIDDFIMNQLNNGERRPEAENLEEERERDRIDADFADMVNRRFAYVNMNGRARKELQ